MVADTGTFQEWFTDLETENPLEYPGYEEKIADYIRKTKGVVRLDLLRTRMFGNKVYIDAEIAVDGTLSLKDAHAIAETVHDNVEKEFANTKHIMIHVNPA